MKKEEVLEIVRKVNEKRGHEALREDIVKVGATWYTRISEDELDDEIVIEEEGDYYVVNAKDAETGATWRNPVWIEK